LQQEIANCLSTIDIINSIHIMKNVLLTLFGFIALWDAFTTVIGTGAYMGTESITFSVIVGGIVLAFMIGTKYIWAQEGGLKTIMVLLWFLALAIDVATSFFGNLAFLGDSFLSDDKKAFLLAVTVLTSASPILVSLMMND